MNPYTVITLSHCSHIRREISREPHELDLARILPAIPPENEELDKGEGVRQGKTEAVNEDREVAELEVREHVRVLIILHYHDRRHVAEPVEIRISRVRPHAGQTKTDLHRATDRAYALHLALLFTAEAYKSTSAKTTPLTKRTCMSFNMLRG